MLSYFEIEKLTRTSYPYQAVRWLLQITGHTFTFFTAQTLHKTQHEFTKPGTNITSTYPVNDPK